MKSVIWQGSSFADLCAFPMDAKRQAGFQLDKVQRGLDPDDWKPMQTVGAGVREIRVRERGGAFRIVYVATFDEYVYVLHAFQKKSQKTSKKDLDIAKARYKAIER